MSKELWGLVLDQIESHGYMSGVDREKSRILETAEVFTPGELVVDILKNIPLENFGPGKLILDPSCGDGQFLSGALAVKMIHFGMSSTEALAEIYGIDIMADNVQLAKNRLGGGNIFHGNALDPRERLRNQALADFNAVAKLLEDTDNPTLF